MLPIRVRYSVGALLLAMTAAAVVSAALRPPTVQARIEFVGRDPDSTEYYSILRFRLTNESPNALWYYGRGEDNPVGTGEALSKGQWWVSTMPLCGMGIGSYKLARGESIEFTEFFEVDDEVVRLGMSLSGYSSMDEDRTIWSRPANCKRQGVQPVALVDP